MASYIPINSDSEMLSLPSVLPGLALRLPLVLRVAGQLVGEPRHGVSLGGKYNII